MNCNVPSYYRKDCIFGDETSCENAGCCWSLVNGEGIPWCFYDHNYTCDVNLNGTAPGFDEAAISIMKEKFE